MAKKSDREAMAAALGGMVSRPTPSAEPAPEPTAKPETAPEAAQAPPEPRPKARARTKPRAQPAARESATAGGEEGGGHRKTGIGYIKADGTEMVRTVLIVTKDERQRLKLMALEAGVSPSDYVREALGFL